MKQAQRTVKAKTSEGCASGAALVGSRASDELGGALMGHAEDAAYVTDRHSLRGQLSCCGAHCLSGFAAQPVGFLPGLAGALDLVGDGLVELRLKAHLEAVLVGVKPGGDE